MPTGREPIWWRSGRPLPTTFPPALWRRSARRCAGSGYRSRSRPVDERLWFDASCGGRDFLVGNAHTFTGRMTAWCPRKGVTYNVSRSELETMAEETRYFVAGFLAGNEPRYPDDDGTGEADLTAWAAATARFRRTGLWYGRWGTCAECGCVLLPDSAGDRCQEHRARPCSVVNNFCQRTA